MIFEHTSYREFLRAFLVTRTGQTPGYSLRTLARDCGLAGSTLSQVLSGKLNLSTTRGRSVARKIMLTAAETSYFCELIALEHARDPSHREEILGRLEAMHPSRRRVSDPGIEVFKIMSEWYHAAILELAMLKDFELSAESAARALSIPRPAAESAIERLIKLGLFERGPDGRISRPQAEIRIECPEKNEAFRRFYRQMFGKGSEALETQTARQRLSRFLNLAVDPRALPEVDQALTRFLREVREINSRLDNPSAVYHLMFHFFNLTPGQGAPHEN